MPATHNILEIGAEEGKYANVEALPLAQAGCHIKGRVIFASRATGQPDTGLSVVRLAQLTSGREGGRLQVLPSDVPMAGKTFLKCCWLSVARL